MPPSHYLDEKPTLMMDPCISGPLSFIHVRQEEHGQHSQLPQLMHPRLSYLSAPLGQRQHTGRITPKHQREVPSSDSSTEGSKRVEDSEDLRDMVFPWVVYRSESSLWSASSSLLQMVRASASASSLASAPWASAPTCRLTLRWLRPLFRASC